MYGIFFFPFLFFFRRGGGGGREEGVKVCFLKVLNEGQEIVPGNIHRFERQFETFHAFHTRAG